MPPVFEFFDEEIQAPALGSCKVAFRPLQGAPWPIGEFPMPVEALRAAEAWVRGEHGELAGLLNKHASWRTTNTPATEKQVKMLKALKIAMPEDLTKGQASALIDRALAIQGPRKASAAQKWRLRQEGVRYDPDLSFAEASTLIEQAAKRRAGLEED
mgnify:CR=1 FL=1